LLGALGAKGCGATPPVTTSRSDAVGGVVGVGVVLAPASSKTGAMSPANATSGSLHPTFIDATTANAAMHRG
jgi:hypothetical protein